MLAFALTLLFLCAGALSSKTFYKLEDAEDHFEEFIQTYGRQYFSEEEKQARFEIFAENLKIINDLNQRNEHAEFGNVEGQYAIKKKELIAFSEQQIVDCDEYSHGCNGGFMTNSMQSLMEMEGIEAEKDYPYIYDENDECIFDKSKVKAKVVGCRQYFNLTEDNMIKLLHAQGPLSIAVNVDTAFFRYKKGILDTCDMGWHANHGVLLVGHGSENGIPYWIVKNSWGEKFGEQGYIRLKRGIEACGLNIYQIASALL